METQSNYTSLMSFYLDLGAFAIAEVCQHEYYAVVSADCELAAVCVYVVAVYVFPVLCADLQAVGLDVPQAEDLGGGEDYFLGVFGESD